jgi:hypothetical protein
MHKRLVVVVAILVVTSAIVTIFISPLDTTVPIPEPSFLNNTTNPNKGIEIIAENLSTPWALDIAKDNRIFFTERDGKIRVIDAKGILIDEPDFILELLKMEVWTLELLFILILQKII